LKNEGPGPVTGPALMLSGVCAPSITSGVTRLLLTTRKKVEAQLKITDAMGRVIKIIRLRLPKGSHSIPIEAAAFPAGMYTITVSATEPMMQPVRFLKQ
jgi:hypothetical protein